ncbi:MAG: response regulator transcription factor [Gallionellaceae bacterium]
MRVLIIEDNADLAANMFDFLEMKGHVVDAAGDGVKGLHLALTGEFEAIVLDLMLPGMDGLTLCRTLREDQIKSVPVLMITARDSLDDKIAGLEAGADDYLVKPVELREVELRLRVLLRRGAVTSQKQRLVVGDVSLNQLRRRVRRAGKIIEMSPIPYKILELLMLRSPNVVTREEIEHAVWGDARPDSDSLRAHMHLLRNLIDKPFERKLLRTLQGFGFQFVDQEDED